MENNLFSVREELSMEGEVVQHCQLTGERQGGNQKGHQNQLRDARDPSASTEEEEVIHVTRAEEGI
jgi:hypothetical protein